MQLDDGATGAPRVAGPRTDTSKVSQEDIDQALKDAAESLGLDDAQIEAGKSDPATFKKLPTESNTDFNNRVVQGYKDFGNLIELTPEEEAAGYTVKFVRTGAGGKGEYRKIRPLNFNVASANTSNSGNGFTFDEGDGTDGGAGNKVYTASNGQTFTDQQAFVDYEISLRESGIKAQLLSDEKKADRKSAYDLLLSEFDRYGLGALVAPLKSLIEENVSPIRVYTSST